MNSSVTDYFFLLVIHIIFLSYSVVKKESVWSDKSCISNCERVSSSV